MLDSKIQTILFTQHATDGSSKVQSINVRRIDTTSHAEISVIMYVYALHLYNITRYNLLLTLAL